jgi:hypothetical protein
MLSHKSKQPAPTQWTITPPDPGTLPAIRKYQQAHPRETASALHNLDRLRQKLNEPIGDKQEIPKYGFLRPEGHGLYRIGQTGIPHPHETRLYITLDHSSRTIHLHGIGDKNTQKRDLAAIKKALKP